MTDANARTHAQRAENASAPSNASPLEVHTQAKPIDLHVDFIIQRRLFGYDPARKHRAGVFGQPFVWHSDLPRMQEAGYGGACLGVHHFPWDSERGWDECQRQLDVYDALCESDEAVRVRTADDWDEAERLGKIGLGVGVEGAHMLNGKLERLELLAERGIHYLTLTHFSKNAFATPGLGRGANERDGLSPLGVDAIHELNRLGVAIDVAHVNGPGVLDACRHTRSPIFCTHTGARALYDTTRNISDEAIDAIAATGGVIGVIFCPIFLNGKLRANSETIADHIDYIVQRVGIEHIAYGSDFDGWVPTIPSDMRDVRDSYRVSEALLKRGYRPEDLRKMFRENTIRAFREVQAGAGMKHGH